MFPQSRGAAARQESSVRSKRTERDERGRKWGNGEERGEGRREDWNIGMQQFKAGHRGVKTKSKKGGGGVETGPKGGLVSKKRERKQASANTQRQQKKKRE